MYRFFLPNLNIKESVVTVSDKTEIHHIKNVLRFQIGDSIALFNGKGEAAIGSITAIHSTEITITLSETHTKKSNKTTYLRLACAIPKKAKFEFIIEKVTELGVDEIVPLITQRTEVILKGEKAEKKQTRYQKIAINAAKQSKRATIPKITPVTPFNTFLKNCSSQNHILIPCLEGKRADIQSAAHHIEQEKIRDVTLIIGPEGDFTANELKTAKQAGCVPVSLGETILKVDTAAIAAVSFIQLFKVKS